VITDPRFAPRRTDVPYLRRRSRKKLRAMTPSAPSAPPAGRAATAVADFVSGGGPQPERHHQPAAPSPPAKAPRPSPPRVSPPAPAPPPRPSAPAPAPVSSSLDLDAPAPAAVAPPVAAAQPGGGASTTLDLDAAALAPAPAAAPGGPGRAAAPAGIRPYPVRRVTAGERTILGGASPTVTLTRTQSGIGTLTIDAACSAEVGDLRLGCAYQLRSGQSSTVQAAGGNQFAPPRSRRPVLVGGRERYERISVDLRQTRDIDRLAVFAFSESGAQLHWGGTLIVTTFAGAKIEVPLEHLAPGSVAVLLSLYNVDGEFVLRAELETISGSIREAARAYGYDRITWLDDRNPVE
jgi:uncharacterized protein involved in tellurium resistance